jgi:diguanylate cyclase (GGDEF)-like protein
MHGRTHRDSHPRRTNAHPVSQSGGVYVTHDPIGRGVQAIWERAHADILRHVSALEGAALVLAADSLADGERQQSGHEARKLATASGTFGFWDSAALAREAELILQGSDDILPTDVVRFTRIVAELRRQLANPRLERRRQRDQIEIPGLTASSTANARLLVIGNDAELRDRLGAEARSLGVDVIGVDSADEARSLLTGAVDAVLLDLALDGAGIPFLEELHHGYPHLPVIVVAEGEQFRDRVEAARLGGRGFLQKPVRPAQVMDLLRDSLIVTRSERTTIVAVDDDVKLLALIETLLRPLGARVVTVTEPLRVLGVLAETAPDLVILDVDMPQLNGIELCRVMRNDPRWAAVPVLFLTDPVEPAAVTRMFEAGADDFVAKPVLGPELVARVRNRIERTRMLRRAADVDSLTGVATRRRGIEVLERLFRLAHRQRQPISIAAIDLDRFKEVNDRFGHLVGDGVLRQVAAILAGCFRGEDIVARWGGEEFVVGMYSMPRNAAVKRLEFALEKLRVARFESGDATFSMTFSAGVAEFPADGTDWTTLYRLADDSLTEAKMLGRNRVVGGSRDAVRPGRDASRPVRETTPS